ncbi:hypothetical protein CR513_43069, partial [Mucuna pruriens]
MVCSRILYGFAGEQEPIKGVIELKTTFGEGNCVRSILVLYTIMDIDMPYNIIMGRPALNKLGAVVSTLHLCMKYSVGKEVGSVWVDTQVAQRCYEDSLRTDSAVNVLDLDLDPRCWFEYEKPLLVEDLKEVHIRPSTAHKTKIDTALEKEEESRLTRFLSKNRDMFAWTPDDMPGIDPNFITKIQADRPEEAEAGRGETKGCQGIDEQATRGRVYQGGAVSNMLANVVMVKKASGKWRMCTNYTDLNKAYLKDPYS